jgi:AcrR family transcriptional regulator
VTTDLDLDEPEKRLVRGEPVIARILEATIEELALVGLEGLTLERVASQAGVNRTTIYRRWPTKEHLVQAALERMAEKDAVELDTGSLRGDLSKLIEHASMKLFAPGTLSLIRTVLGAPSDSPLCQFAQCAHDERRRGVLDMLDRAEERGELRSDIDKELFMDGVFGMLFTRLVFKRERPTPEFAERVLEQMLRLAAPLGAPATPRRGTQRPKAAPRPKPTRRAPAKKTAGKTRRSR